MIRSLVLLITGKMECHGQLRYFFLGCRSGLPIAIGYLPIALAFGVLARTAGLSAGEATAMSALVFAGASQFMAINLISGGASAATIILATFVVNFRHFVMSASLSRRLVLRWWEAALVGFGLTDETFVVNSLARPDELPGQSVRGGYICPKVRESKGDKSYECSVQEITPHTATSLLPPGFALGVSLMAYLAWVSGSWMGVVFAGIIPPVLTAGMEIALYAMFIGLLMPAIRRAAPAGLIALGSAGICWLLSLFFDTGWAIVLATVVVAGIGVPLLGRRVDSL